MTTTDHTISCTENVRTSLKNHDCEIYEYIEYMSNDFYFLLFDSRFIYRRICLLWLAVVLSLKSVMVAFSTKNVHFHQE